MIRVIIERHIAPTLEIPYEETAKRTLQKAVQVSGFISGETLKNTVDHNHRVILSTWRSLQDWQRWYTSDERKEMLAELSPMLEREEHITALEIS
ncbi:MAG: antibiotic biosynthesis monooxygenase [Hahellaceae bacterium]|jgi:heme-degrading monooxygenase HmoA|nr:antibiotic biosynthesis monooxygenase [Hahellaceae bacterium]MCP5212855.1 antibiotic biosynthesis monooxygenase [Hahellaceae bacterium]